MNDDGDQESSFTLLAYAACVGRCAANGGWKGKSWRPCCPSVRAGWHAGGGGERGWLACYGSSASSSSSASSYSRPMRWTRVGSPTAWLTTRSTERAPSRSPMLPQHSARARSAPPRSWYRRLAVDARKSPSPAALVATSGIATEVSYSGSRAWLAASRARFPTADAAPAPAPTRPSCRDLISRPAPREVGEYRRSAPDLSKTWLGSAVRACASWFLERLP